LFESLNVYDNHAERLYTSGSAATCNALVSSLCALNLPKAIPTVVKTKYMSETPSATASSSNYQSIFENSLEAYRRKTKKDIRSHPLLAKLQTCNSPDAVLTLLLDQIPIFDQSRSTGGVNARLTSWLDPTVNVLYAFSAAIGGGIGLVSVGGSNASLFRI
jgi:hypothetical protein